MKRFLICLQFFSDDKATAMRLARMLSDVEPAFRDDAEILFVARFDCEHDHETIAYVGQKFPTNWITTHTRWTGWPSGPNAVALDTLQWVAANRPEAAGVLMLEPDVVPTSPDWLNRLMDFWDEALMADKWVMGDWRPSGGEHGHINGVCVVRPDFANLIPLRDIIGPDYAWDCCHSPYTRAHWHAKGIIRNCFQGRKASWADLVHGRDMLDTIPVLVHGFKDDSAYEIARSLCGLAAEIKV